MRNISPALATHFAGDVRTIATLVLVQRKDGQVFGFTDHDANITLSGQVYATGNSYSASAVDMSSDLSTSNMEVRMLLDNAVITQADLEGGLWNNAAVTVSLCNFNDLTMGAVVIGSGTLGQVKIYESQYVVEMRSLSQMMQQQTGELFSPTCRATLGDTRCTVALGPLTATGLVQSLNSIVSWNDSTLTQTGPNSNYVDTQGRKIPTSGAYTIKVVPPTGGAFVSDNGVHDTQGNSWTQVGSSPGDKQYTVAPDGTYTFSSSDPGYEVYINYVYSIGYFSYGRVTFTSGANSGYTLEVKSFSPGVVTLTLPPPFPIAVGDTYSIVAGCDRLFGTCKSRFNNVVHFRGEPYIPGPDTLLRPQNS
jgi:hypothetical protein